MCFWCAESHEGGPTHCPMKGKIRLHPITRERANKFEEDGGLSLSLSSSVDFNSLRYSEHDPLVLRMSGDDFSSFPRCSCLEEGTFVLVDSKTDWCGMEEEAKKRFGEGGFENLKEKVLKGDEKTRGFARKKNLTQYLIEDATALIEYSALFQANGSQGREFVQAVRRSRVFSIVSGDKLLAGAIEWVVERGFRVRMYAWEESCPEVYLRFQEMYEGLFELNYLNNLFSDIKEKLPQKEESKNIPLAPPPCLPLEKKEESQKKVSLYIFTPSHSNCLFTILNCWIFSRAKRLQDGPRWGRLNEKKKCKILGTSLTAHPCEGLAIVSREKGAFMRE